MIRSKKFYATGSIVSISIMFLSLMLGFVEDGHHSYYSYWYSYSDTYYTSFADEGGTGYWLLFFLASVYIALSIVAIALYNKRIKAINIVNIVLTPIVYSYAMIEALVAIDYGNDVFGWCMLLLAVGVAFPFHLVVEIFALVAQKYKAPANRPFYVTQQPVYAPQAMPVNPAANTDAIEMLKRLKALYDAGALTEEEYNEKRQQYINQI